MRALHKRDKAITEGSAARFCCVGHDGSRKSHKRNAARRLRRNVNRALRQARA